MKTVLLLGVLMGAVAMWPGMERSEGGDAVSFVQALQWHHRVVIVAADDEHLPQLDAQAARFGAHRETLRDEHVVVVTVRPEGVTAGSRHEFDADAARQLREYYELDGNGFTVLVIGKDGGEKARYDEVVDPDALLAGLDDFPARERDARGALVL
jgi:hypothetical protein